MRIHVDLPTGTRIALQSKDPEVITLWFKREVIPILIKVNASMPPASLEIWGEGDDEIRHVRHYIQLGTRDYTPFRELGYLFLGMAGKGNLQ